MSWTRPQEVVVLAGAAVTLVASGLLLVVRRPAPPIRIIQAPQSAEVVVQVDGAVARPGVYRLPSGARLGEALAAAGGLRADADGGALNRAHLLRDGERVSVPPHGHTRDVGDDAGDHRPGARRAGAGVPRSAAGPGGRPIDLNTATTAELEMLPGIGPVLARRIVERRTAHGAFRRVEDLLEVKGIGFRLLERLRPHVVIR